MTAKIPPSRCGVGDYTWRLAEELAKAHDVHILTSVGKTADSRERAFDVHAVVPDWGPIGMIALWRTVRLLQPDWINIEYVPFLYHRLGLNVFLPTTVVLLRAAGYRTVLTVHEPYVPLKPGHWAITGPIQRLLLFVLGLGSAKIAVSISSWTSILRRWFFWRSTDIFWLPVGSNVPCVPMSADERSRQRAALGFHKDDVVLAAFSPIGSGKLVHWLSRMWTDLGRDARVVLLVLGRTDEEIATFDPSWRSHPRVICTGDLDFRRLSTYLSCADVAVAPLADGVSTRRGSVIAALEHALPVVTTRGESTDMLFERSPLVMAPADNPDAFVSAVKTLIDDVDARATLAAASRRFWAEHFSWSVLAAGLMSHQSETRLAPRTSGAGICQ